MSSSPSAPALSCARGRFALSTAIFLRLLAVTHFVAFLSLWVQLSGLIGPHGILPAGPFLKNVHDQIGTSAYARLPTLCWLLGANSFLSVLCAAGIGLSLLLFFDIAPAICLALLWLCYLSLVNVGQIFLGFQWDALLLETTLLAIFLAPWSFRSFPWGRGALAAHREPPRIALWLLRWLLFRLMLLSGVVKLSSGDPTWRDFSALAYHYETQPLPNPLAWWMHQLPAAFHRACCAGMFTIELFVPFFLFAPRPLRHNAALLLLSLQLVISLTGNFAFFNLLTIALCLLCLDDAWWHSLLPFRSPGEFRLKRETASSASAPSRSRWFPVAIAGLAFYVGYTSLLAAPNFVRSFRWPAWFDSLAAAVGPFESLNNYGLFAVMTTSRPELIFEGSDDGRDWRAYEFPDKPGNLSRRPPIVAPHQPRLDWQLWFAALGSPAQNRWVLSVCEHLLRGTPEVLALFARNPFPQKPPRYIRVVRYDYEFTTPAVRARTGRWWSRTPLDFYIEPASLQ